MKKQLILATALASLVLTPLTTNADYYSYVDELRKPGQSVEEAKQEQISDYQKTMKEKYSKVEVDNKGFRGLTKEEIAKIRKQHRKLERQATSQRLDLTDDQKSKLEELHAQLEVFMKKKRQEVMEFRKQQKERFLDILTDDQKKRMNNLQTSSNS